MAFQSPVKTIPKERSIAVPFVCHAADSITQDCFCCAVPLKIVKTMWHYGPGTWQHVKVGFLCKGQGPYADHGFIGGRRGQCQSKLQFKKINTMNGGRSLLKLAFAAGSWCRAVFFVSTTSYSQSSNMTRQQNKQRCERLDIILVARHEDIDAVYPQ